MIIRSKLDRPSEDLEVLCIVAETRSNVFDGLCLCLGGVSEIQSALVRRFLIVILTSNCGFSNASSLLVADREVKNPA